MDHEEAIAMFIAVTDAPRHIAEHVLDAHHWDLNNSVAFFLESGGVGHGFPNADCAPALEPDNAGAHSLDTAPAGLAGPPEDLTDAQPVQVPIDEDEDLQILASSLSRRPRARQAVGPGSGDDADVQLVGSLEDEFAVEHSNGRRPRRNRPRAAGALDEDLRRLGQRFGVLDDNSDLPTTSMLAPLRPASQPVQGADEPALPDDVDMEEQKMLMAALTGSEYEGQLPDFSAEARFRPAQLSPGAQERQQLRAEQDAAYYESLQADMEREAAEAAAKQEADLAERRAREVEEAEEQRQREEQLRLERTISSKQASLPPEPEEGGEGVVSIMIRMPKGTRLNRRFRTTDSLQSVFDFVDVQRLEEAKPHTYHLVMQYPRRTFEEHSELSLGEVGLKARQEALFLEMK